MDRCVRLLFVLFVLGALDVCFCAASTKENAKFHLVKQKTDLWRYLVGANAAGLTIGNTHLCILSYKNQFLASRIGQVYHDRGWCQREERFVVKFVEDGKVTIQPMLSEEYISCMDFGAAILQGELGETQKWELYLNEDDDQLAFYSPIQKKYMVAKEGGGVSCDASDRESAAMFSGWREGPKEAWEPREEGRKIQRFGNARGRTTKSFDFEKIIGVKKVEGSKAKVRADELKIDGVGLSRKFKVDYESELQMEWAAEDAKVWKDATTVKATWGVEPKMIVTLYQAVGIYGPLEIYSDNIMELETEAGGPQDRQFEWLK